jgi:hypothetical protein
VTTLLAIAALLDRALSALAAGAAVWLLVDLVRHRGVAPGAWRPSDRLPCRIELALLAVILATAAACRLVFLSRPATPPYWDSTVNTVMVDQMLHGAGFLATLESIGRPFQGHSYFVHIPMLLPVATAVQRLAGPSLELQGYIGAVMAFASIVLAWLLGRAYRGPLFGILFAALLALSLTQLLWSRLGGTYLGGIPHVLAVSLCGFEAGRRNSLVLAILGALLAWLSLYNHYQARVCLPLIYVAIVSGALRHPRPLRAAAVQALAVTLVLAAAYATLGGDLRATLWPAMGGEVGNQGEATLGDVIRKNLQPSVVRLRQCARLLVAGRRASMRTQAVWGWGLEHGGMLLAPVIVLGLVGFAVSLVRITRHALPLAITLLGLALAVLSEPQVRKLLVFDMGWQFLAAIGLYALLHHRLLAGLRRRTLLVAGVVAFLALGAWGLGAVAITSLRAGPLELPYRQFALPLFGDDFDSPRAFRVATLWERWMRGGDDVVFVNTDFLANNFATYGGVAALQARRAPAFRSFYPLDTSANMPPGSVSDLFGRTAPVSAALLDAVLEGGGHGMVWWFERPTRWDEWLIDEFARRGGIVRPWPDGAAEGPWGAPSVAVVLERRVLRDALSALDVVDVAGPGAGDLCLELSAGERRPLPTPFVSAIARWHRPDGPAEWVVLALDGVHVGSQRVPLREPVGVAGLDGPELAVIDGWGTETRLRVAPSGVVEVLAATPRLSVPRPVGSNCAARVGDDWWVVDPLSGILYGSQPLDWLPRRPWIALTDGGEGRLVLASADQHVAIVRPASRTVEREFPAHVWEGLKHFDFGSCPVIRMLDGYVASFSLSTGLVALYTTEGDAVTALRLTDALPKLIESRVAAIDVSDRLLVLTEAAAAPMMQAYAQAIGPKREGCERGVRLLNPGPRASRSAP